MTTTTEPDRSTATRNPRVAFVSLGCAKNLVDSEVMIGKLGAAGWDLVPDSGDADAIVVNTCAFIDPAKAESTDVILEHAQRKREDQQLIVAGCLSQRFGTSCNR
jgi:ribosomal protein S12 methylthiotransferase